MVYDRTGSRKAAALAFWAMAFAGPLTWILHLSPARTPNILQTIADRGQPAVGLHPVATGYQTYPFGFMLNNLNIVFAVGLALAAAAHCELLLREPGWRKRLNLVVTLAALALSLETAFAAFAAALAFYGLAVKSCRREVLPLILGAGILVLFQGGVVTDWLLSGGDTVPALHRLALRWPPGFPAWGEAMPSLSHPMQLLRFLAADYGLTFWCLPLAALGMLRASSPAVSLLSLCAACGLAVPFFLRYPVADWDMSKFLAVSSFILPVPYACGWWTERKRRWLNEALLALMAASTVGFVLRFAAQARWPVQPPPALVRGVDIPAGAWLRGNVPAGSVFLSDVPLLVVNQGFFALAQVRRHAQVPPFDLAGTLERLDAAELRTLGVDYVYLTRERCAGRALKLQEAGGFGFVRDFDAQRFLFRVLPADHPSRVPSS